MKTRVAKIQNQKRGKSVIQWKDIAEIGKIKWIYLKIIALKKGKSKYK